MMNNFNQSNLGAMQMTASLSTSSDQQLNTAFPTSILATKGGKNATKDDLYTPPKAKKKRRVQYSCTECSRRKQRCSRTSPCGQCVERGLAHQCNFQTIDATQQQQLHHHHDSDDELHRRSSLQEMRRRTSQQYFGHLARTPSLTSRNSEPLLWDPKDSNHPIEIPTFPENARRDSAHSMTNSNFTAKFNNFLESLTGTQETVTLTDPTRDIQGSADLDSLMYDYGATDSTVQAFMSVFPERELADALIHHFFHDINWLTQPISQKIFRHYYNRFWASKKTKLKADDINTYALIVCTMAVSMCSFEREDLAVKDPKLLRTAARGLCFAGQRALMASVTLGRYNIQQVLAYCMASRFLYLDNRNTEAWICAGNAVGSAQWIGMHRDGSKLQLPKWECEARRRIWSTVYTTDRINSLTLCRPSHINDSLVDTALPSEEDELDLFVEIFRSTIPHMGKNLPTPLSYARVRHCLAFIQGKIIMAYQGLQKPFYSRDISRINDEIERFREKEIPVCFQVKVDTQRGLVNPIDGSWDDAYPYVMIHRFLIQRKIETTLISLHRPLFLRTSSSSSSHQYAFNRLACVSAAHRSLLLQQDIVKMLEKKFQGRRIPKAYHIHLGTYYTLIALIIIGIHLLTSQHQDLKRDNELFNTLQHYLHIYSSPSSTMEEHHLKDDVRKREADILRVIVKRIEEMRLMSSPQSITRSDEGMPSIPEQQQQQQQPVIAPAQSLLPSTSTQSERILGNNQVDFSDAELLLSKYLSKMSEDQPIMYDNNFVGDDFPWSTTMAYQDAQQSDALLTANDGNVVSNGAVFGHNPLFTSSYTTNDNNINAATTSNSSSNTNDPDPSMAAPAATTTTTTTAEHLFESWFPTDPPFTNDEQNVNSLDQGPNRLQNIWFPESFQIK